MYLLTAKEQALDKARKLIMSKKQKKLKGSPGGRHQMGRMSYVSTLTMSDAILAVMSEIEAFQSNEGGRWVLRI